MAGELSSFKLHWEDMELPAYMKRVTRVRSVKKARKKPAARAVAIPKFSYSGTAAKR